MQDSRAIGKELIQSVPLQKQNWRVSKEDIHRISRLISPAWWERLAHKLCFDSDEVDEIKKYEGDFDNQRYKLLVRWNNRFGHKATYKKILDGLLDIEAIDTLDEVCKLLHTQTEPGPPLPSALDRYSDDLKREYSSYRLRSIVDWPPPPNENFIKLAMIREHGLRCGTIDPIFVANMTQGNIQNVLEKKVEIQPDEIFNTDLSEGKVLLVEGAPGSGKTTLCWYICQQWGRGKLFQQFSHVLMVELRDRNTQAAKCLADFLPFCEDNYIAEKMENKSGDNALIILDGWNELPEPMRKQSIFHNLLKKKKQGCILRHAVVLISSRSNVTADLHSDVDIRVETLGFTPDQIERYVCGSFEQEPEKAEDLLAKIRQNPKLQGNCYLPLILTLIVHLYCASDNQLPESFCGVIIELTLTCLYRYRRNTLKLKGGFDSFEDKDIPSDIKPQFLRLCKLAYEATMEERYSFSNLETEGFLGLIQTVESLSKRENQTTQYFFHSSLQELCAAVYISTQPIPEQIDLIKRVFDNQNDYVLRFYSSLTRWKEGSVCKVLLENSAIIQFFNDTTQIHLMTYPEKPVEISQPLFQMAEIMAQMFPMVDEPYDQEKLVSSMGDVQKVECLAEEPSKNLPIENSACSFNLDDFICRLLNNYRRSVLENCDETSGVDIKEYEEIMESHFSLANKILGQALREISDALDQEDPKAISASDSKFQKMIMRGLKEDSKYTTFLQQQLHVSSFDCTDDMLMLLHCIYESRSPALAQILGPSLVLMGRLNASDLIALQSVLDMKEGGTCTCNVETLSLVSALTPTEIMIVVKAIKSNSTIRKLEVNFGCYHEDLVRTVLLKPTITHFTYKWIIPDKKNRIFSCKSLSSCLMHNDNLKVLDLSDEQILDVGAKEIASVLNTTQLVELNLSNCGLERRGIEALSTTLASNSYLSILHLNDTITSLDALKCLSYSLNQNNTLKVLGMVEDPVLTELSEENLAEFILHLTFNSSVVYVVLNEKRTGVALIQQAVATVNITRKHNQQPQFSISDHYTSSEIYMDTAMNTEEAFCRYVLKYTYTC